MTTIRRQLTPEEQNDSDRLLCVWNQKKQVLGLTQADVAKQFGIANQTAISQYLNGRIPLNLEAAVKFSKILQVRLGDISPCHAEMVGNPNTDSVSHKAASIVGETCPGTVVYLEVDDAACPPEIASKDTIAVCPCELEKDGIYAFDFRGAISVRRVTATETGVRIYNADDTYQEISRANIGIVNAIGRVVLVLHRV